MLSIAVVGRAMADLAGIKHTSGVKQIDRLLSNEGLPVDGLERLWVRYVVGGLPELTVAIDWTDFDDDGHTTLRVYRVTRAGRALPLVWRTAKKSGLKDIQKRLETEMLERLVDWITEGTKLTLPAVRGFGKIIWPTCERAPNDRPKPSVRGNPDGRALSAEELLIGVPSLLEKREFLRGCVSTIESMVPITYAVDGVPVRDPSYRAEGKRTGLSMEVLMVRPRPLKHPGVLGPFQVGYRVHHFDGTRGVRRGCCAVGSEGHENE